MNSLKRTKWTRLAPIFLTVALVLPCLLMTVERSGRGALTTKADYTFYQQLPFDFTQSYQGSQFTIENNQIIKISIFRTPYASDGRAYVRLETLTWTGADANNNPLEYGIIQREYNGTTPYLETEYVDNGTPINIYPEVQRPTDTSPHYSYDIYIRRKDGGVLTPSDMERSIVTLGGFIRYDTAVTTAIPQNWLETTTASFQNPMDTYTTIIPTDYDISSSQYDPLLEIPSKIDTAINFIILGFGRIMNFRYISFVVCFVLIVGLVAWLIH